MPTIELKKIPGNLDEFKELYATLPDSPVAAAAAMILALLLYSENSEEGAKALSLAAHPDHLVATGETERLNQHSLNLLKMQIKGKSYHMQSYFKNTSTANNYALPPAPCLLEFSTNPHSTSAGEGYLKLFIQSSGADSPRPLSVKIDGTGKWKAVEWSSLLSGIKKIKL